jgi:hypothetical protein
MNRSLIITVGERLAKLYQANFVHGNVEMLT